MLAALLSLDTLSTAYILAALGSALVLYAAPDFGHLRATKKVAYRCLWLTFPLLMCTFESLWWHCVV